MKELLISKQQIHINKTKLEPILNNTTNAIKDRLTAIEGNGKNLEIYNNLLTFFAEQRAVWDILKRAVKNIAHDGPHFIYASYIAAERAIDSLYPPLGIEETEPVDFFRRCSLNFSQNYPYPRDSMLETYSTVLWSNKNADLDSLTNNYFIWIRDQTLNAKENPASNEHNKIISTELSIKFEGDTRLFKGFESASYIPEKLGNVERFTWDDFGGYGEVKEKLKDLVIIIKNVDFFKQYIPIECMFPRGILLIGPPGTGKTFLANILCSEAGIPFISFGAEDIGSKYQFETSIRLKKKFQEAAYHIIKGSHPASLLFIDEIEAITATRYNSHDNNDAAKVVNTFNAYMCGNKATPGVIVVGATNRSDIMDDAILRSGRFSYKFYIGYPDDSALKSIFEVHARKCNEYAVTSVFKDPDCSELSKLCSNAELIKQTAKPKLYLPAEGFTGAVVQEIYERALRDYVLNCFKQGKEVTPLTTEHLVSYVNLFKEGKL